MAFVNKQGGDEKRDTKAASGQPIEFDPHDDSVVKVHYDLGAWTFDQRAELAESLADAELPHAWDGEELLVPEVVEDAADALFERLEAEMGPFPIGLDDDAESTEFKLDEWTPGDRQTLTDAMVESEIPHRWVGTTVLVAADADETVDDLLDAIEEGELSSVDDDDAVVAPDGALSDIFLAANKLAKDPFDAKSRRTLIDLNAHIDKKHPPYALAPRVWGQTVLGVDAIVERIRKDADGDKVDGSGGGRGGGGRNGGGRGDGGHSGRGDDGDADDRLDESSDVIGLAQALREIVRDYV